MLALAERPYSKTAETHLHLGVRLSDGAMRAEEAVELVVALGIDGLVVTDHNTIEGAEVARDYAFRHHPSLEFELGVEVTLVDERHLLAIGIDGPIKPRQTLEAAVKEIKERNGVAILAHPFHHAESTVEDVLLVDGFEVHNATLSEFAAGRIANERAKVLFDRSRTGKTATAGTDAHFYRAGRAKVGYNGRLLDALRQSTTVPLVAEEEEEQFIRETATAMFGLSRVRQEEKFAKKFENGGVVYAAR